MIVWPVKNEHWYKGKIASPIGKSGSGIHFQASSQLIDSWRQPAEPGHASSYLIQVAEVVSDAMQWLAAASRHGSGLGSLPPMALFLLNLRQTVAD